MTVTGLHGASDVRRGAPTEVRRGPPVELAVAFTDLEDFTTYTEAEGDAAASCLLIGHHRESELIVRSRGGRVLKRLGDGLMLTFPGTEAAVLACLTLGETAPLRLRGGIHRGNVVVTDDDVVGHAVNLAARVAEIAEGGELIVTDLCDIAVGDSRAVTFDGPYLRSFKGIREPVPVYLVSRHAAGSLDIRHSRIAPRSLRR